MKPYKSDTTNQKIAEDLQNKSKIAITDEIDRLSQELDTDVRENLPPQMMAVVVGVLQLIEDIEGEQRESK